MSKPEPPNFSHRDFVTVFADLDDGAVADNATECLIDLVNAVREANRKGSITITISAEPEGRQVTLDAKVTVKMPSKETNATVFYATDDGQLTRNDPKQTALDLRDPIGEAMRDDKPLRRPRASKDVGDDD